MGTGFLSTRNESCGSDGLGVEKLLIAYDGGGPSAFMRGGLVLLLSFRLQSFPSALAMEDEKVSSTVFLRSGINPDEEALFAEYVG